MAQVNRLAADALPSLYADAVLFLGGKREGRKEGGVPADVFSVLVGWWPALKKKKKKGGVIVVACSP